MRLVQCPEVAKIFESLRSCVLFAIRFYTSLFIVNRNTDMVRKAGKLQRLSAEMLTYLFAFVTWYAKVHICVVSKE